MSIYYNELHFVASNVTRQPPHHSEHLKLCIITPHLFYFNIITPTMSSITTYINDNVSWTNLGSDCPDLKPISSHNGQLSNGQWRESFYSEYSSNWKTSSNNHIRSCRMRGKGLINLCIATLGAVE